MALCAAKGELTLKGTAELSTLWDITGCGQPLPLTATTGDLSVDLTRQGGLGPSCLEEGGDTGKSGQGVSGYYDNTGLCN